jgi:integrase/recombinase XerD
MAGSGVMSSLGAVLSDYLALRRALGCKLISAEGLLRQFVAHCDARGVTVVTSDVAVAWAMLPAGRSTAWWQTRLAAVRPFARWLQALEPATEVPALDAFGRVRSRRATPYIYSDDDVHALMQAASRLQRRLTRITYATLIGLLAATGMRSGEAIRLSRDDIDWKAGSLCVLNSKFGKSRMLMLHPSTTAALQAYAWERDRLFPLPQDPNFLISTAGRQLIHCGVTVTFHKLLEWTGLGAERAGARPRLHDLRHTFALKTLRDWHAAGIDVEARLPLLSTYLGHANPKDTYWYLSASPDLLGAAAARLTAHSKGVSV